MKLNKTHIAIAVIIVVLIIAIILYKNREKVSQKIKSIMNPNDTIKPFVYTGKDTKKRWYEWIIPLAKEVGVKYGLPWQALVAQTALETGWGKSSLLTKHNNFGGIKFAGSGAPAKAILRTREVYNGVEKFINAEFASWPTPKEGLEGYANFFIRNQRYKEALKYPNDPYKFIEEIKKAGYATAPDYVTILHGMIKNIA